MFFKEKKVSSAQFIQNKACPPLPHLKINGTLFLAVLATTCLLAGVVIVCTVAIPSTLNFAVLYPLHTGLAAFAAFVILTWCILLLARSAPPSSHVDFVPNEQAQHQIATDPDNYSGAPTALHEASPHALWHDEPVDNTTVHPAHSPNRRLIEPDTDSIPIHLPATSNTPAWQPVVATETPNSQAKILEELSKSLRESALRNEQSSHIRTEQTISPLGEQKKQHGNGATGNAIAIFGHESPTKNDLPEAFAPIIDFPASDSNTQSHIAANPFISPAELQTLLLTPQPNQPFEPDWWHEEILPEESPQQETSSSIFSVANGAQSTQTPDTSNAPTPQPPHTNTEKTLDQPIASSAIPPAQATSSPDLSEETIPSHEASANSGVLFTLENLLRKFGVQAPKINQEIEHVNSEASRDNNLKKENNNSGHKKDEVQRTSDESTSDDAPINTTKPQETPISPPDLLEKELSALKISGRDLQSRLFNLVADFETLGNTIPPNLSSGKSNHTAYPVRDVLTEPAERAPNATLACLHQAVAAVEAMALRCRTLETAINTGIGNLDWNTAVRLTWQEQLGIAREQMTALTNTSKTTVESLREAVRSSDHHAEQSFAQHPTPPLNEELRSRSERLMAEATTIAHDFAQWLESLDTLGCQKGT